MTFGDLRDWFGFSDQGSAVSHGHGHTHGVIDAAIASTDRGIWAIKWSFIVLAITAAFQIGVVLVSGSVALLADTIHNVADATTAIPLWIAFRLARREPTETFTYGLGRVEDLAGLAIVGIILLSAIVAGYEAIERIFHPQPIAALVWVALAGLVGFIGNEVVAVFRIRVGREINSAALIADGYHARTDGLTSLAVVLGAFGVWLGFPLADPIIGLLITAAIFLIVWQSARSVLTRMLDGVEPGMVAQISHAAENVAGLKQVTDIKARWLGHRLHTDVAILVDQKLTVSDGDAVADKLRDELFAHIPALSVANVRVRASNPSTGMHPPGNDGHHHSPDPFRFAVAMADGVVDIIDTPQGERMRLTLSRQVSGLVATVTIDRPGGQIETLELKPDAAKDQTFMSSVAPREPHEFDAQLRLRAGDQSDVLPLRMVEPLGHAH